mmetsp:Transcript_11040/g.23823  ORF Transcript_11040/g.23823 Transcript_11040/m.23823 type:complete len:200 (+) Transcript_11040:160-759(+)
MVGRGTRQMAPCPGGHHRASSTCRSGSHGFPRLIACLPGLICCAEHPAHQGAARAVMQPAEAAGGLVVAVQPGRRHRPCHVDLPSICRHLYGDRSVVAILPIQLTIHIQQHVTCDREGKREPKHSAQRSSPHKGRHDPPCMRCRGACGGAMGLLLRWAVDVSSMRLCLLLNLHLLLLFVNDNCNWLLRRCKAATSYFIQ